MKQKPLALLPRKTGKTHAVLIKFPAELVRAIDDNIHFHGYANRSEFIIAAANDRICALLKKSKP